MDVTTVSSLSDADLLTRVERIVQGERHATVVLIVHLAEIEHRGLYLREGYGSMFNYCVQSLHLSEYAAYHRIEAARLAVRFPALLEALERGDVHLAAVRQIAPILTFENHVEVLAGAKHKTKREIAEWVGARHPRPAVVASIRKVAVGKVVAEAGSEPEAAVAGGVAGGVVGGVITDPTTVPRSSPAPGLTDSRAGSGDRDAAGEGSPGDAPAFALSPQRAAKAEIVPLGAQRYRVQFTASAATHDKLRRAQELLRHRIPGGDLGAVIDQALDLLVRDLEKKKFAAVDRPRRTERSTGESRTGERSTGESSTAGRSTGEGNSGEGHAGARRAASATSLQLRVSTARKEPANAPAQTQTPSHGAASGAASRHIPAHVKREVWQRDQGRCAFRSPSGVRCTERGALEFDHIRPFADGGAATVDNVRLLCRQHNQYEALQFFGPWQSDGPAA